MRLPDNCEVHARYYVNTLAADRFIGDIDYLAERQLQQELAQVIAHKEGLLKKEELQEYGQIIYQADLYVFTREELNQLIYNIQQEMVYHHPFSFPPRIK